MICMKQIIEMSYPDLKRICKDDNEIATLNEKIISGYIVIVRGVVAKSKIKKFLEEIINSNIPISESTAIIEGVKNIHYISNNIGKNSGMYSSRDQSWYFFPWNEDDLNVLGFFQEIYNNVLLLNNRIPSEIIKNTPKNGIVQRLHLIHYPPDFGEISMHIDPVNVASVNSGIYFSQHGVDYENGGFYSVNDKGEEICVDKLINTGDMVLFYPGMIHGVRPIKALLNKESVLQGRFFFNMAMVESHEVRDRMKSIGIDENALR